MPVKGGKTKLYFPYMFLLKRNMITPAYGDCALALSICEYAQENGIFVVVARKNE